MLAHASNTHPGASEGVPAQCRSSHAGVGESAAEPARGSYQKQDSFAFSSGEALPRGQRVTRPLHSEVPGLSGKAAATPRSRGLLGRAGHPALPGRGGGALRLRGCTHSLGLSGNSLEARARTVSVGPGAQCPGGLAGEHCSQGRIKRSCVGGPRASAGKEHSVPSQPC